jgi:hypothetical protein
MPEFGDKLVGNISGMISVEIQDAQRRTCPDLILSIRSSTETTLGLNLGLCDEKLATNYPNYGTNSVALSPQANYAV